MALARRENLAVFHARLRPVALTALTLLPLLSPSAGRTQELTYETHDDAVRARRGDQVLWENRHWSDRGGQLGGEIVGPVVAAEAVYYVFGISVYEVDAGTGVVRRRMRLPDRPSALALDGDAVVVTVEALHEARGWTRSYRLGPDLPAPPFFPGGSVIYARALRREAASLADLHGVAPRPPRQGRR